MKTLFATLLLAVGTLTSSADVLIYKLKLTTTETGGGFSSKYSNGGYFVLDAESGEVWRIVTDPRAKTFYYEDFSSATIDEVTGAAGKEYNVVTQHDSWTDTAGFERIQHATIKGAKVRNVDIGATTLYSIPKSFTWIGRELGSYTTGDAFLAEITGSLSLDLKSSKISNLADDDINAALDRLASLLITQGYTQE